MSTKEETTTNFELSKEELFEDEEFKELVKEYNKIQKSKKKPEKTIEELYEICWEKWKQADLSSDLLFGMFCDDLEVSQRLINLFLKSKGKEIGSIRKITRQQVVDLGFDIRGVRFDVLVEGSDKVVNIEMQTGTKADLELRIRFYQAILDIMLLPKGGVKGFKMLPETYIIFICTDQDPVDEGELEYWINPYAYIKRTKKYKLFNTKFNWIVYNASAYEDYNEDCEDYDEDLKSFFAFLKNNPIDNDFTNFLRNHFMKVKANEEMGRDFMLTMVRDIDIFDEGFGEGFDGAMFKVVLNMINKNYSDDEIQEVSELSIGEIEHIRESYLGSQL